MSKREQERNKTIAELYPELTMAEISMRYNITKQRVNQILEQQGIGGFKRRRPKSSAWNNIDEIVRRYQSGESAPKIGADYEIDAATIVNMLESKGIKRRHRFATQHHNHMCQMRRDGKLLGEIAREFNHSTQYIWRIIDRAKKEGTY